MGDLYLDGNTEIDDCCRMSLYSAVTLFVYRFCQVNQHLTPYFVTVRIHNACSFVHLSLLIQLKI